MAKYVIEDTTLTGIADAIRGKTGGTDPIPVTDMASQIAAITGGGSGETVTTIFEEQTVEGFVGDTEAGVAHTMIDTTSALVVGESYKVLWDGTEVTLVAIDTDGLPCLNNEVGGFAVMYLSPEIMAEIMGTESGAFQFISMDTEATSHTIGIYQVAGGTSSGGGSVEGIVYVTFMNGNTELCKTACMVGDCSIDPVECAKIAVPTKEPTVSTVYTYAGWSLTEGGEADVAALVDVTEDRVVYAVYAESAREYTINFYDGDTLIECRQVGYGAIPSAPTVEEKAGYAFSGWEPELAIVTGDADYRAVWLEALEITDDWDTIIAAVKDGTYKTKYAVGMYKPLDLGDLGTINMELVAFNCDYYENSTSTVKTTWIAKDLLAVTQPFNSDGDANYGWVDSELRTYCSGTVLTAMPESVQNALKSVLKMQYTCQTITAGTNVYEQSYADDTYDKVWIPSCTEIFGSFTDNERPDNKVSSIIYPVYSDIYNTPPFVKCLAGTDTATAWWLRTSYGSVSTTPFGKSASNIATAVNVSGNQVSVYSASYNYGVCIGFCI